MGMLSHLTCPLRNLNVGQEATVRTRHGTTRHGTTRHGTTDWFKIGKGVWQGCILLPFLFNLYAEYIMWNAGLDESQAEIKNAGRNISNLRYADDTTLMGRKWRGNKASWWGWEKMKKLAWKSIFKKLRSWHLVPSLHGKYKRKKVETVTDFIFLGSKITVDDDYSHEIKRGLLLRRKAMANLAVY